MSGMRVTMLLVGMALIVVGIVWILQGADVLKGSFMTGRPFWAWMGALFVLLGLPVLLRAMRRAR